MADALLSGIDASQTLEATLTLPYTLTTGPAAGSFLHELGNRRLLGSRCTQCDRVTAPAQDYCIMCGSAMPDLLEMPQTGTVRALTRTASGTFILVQLDGADTTFLHRLDGASAGEVGSRVRAVWAQDPTQSVLDLDHFRLDEEPPRDATPIAAEGVEAVAQLGYSMTLDYHHSYGPHYGRLFDELASRRRIVGSRCPKCRNVLVPPREFCDLCFVRTASHVDVSDTGRLQAYSIIHLEFVGQTRKPPYVYAEIMLDGSATRLIHNLGGFDVADAKELLSIGMAVKAVWKQPEQCIGTLDDIEYFEPLLPGDG